LHQADYTMEEEGIRDQATRDQETR
jgi:hypothetical protein